MHSGYRLLNYFYKFFYNSLFFFSVIFLVCFLFSISAAFEFQLVSVEYKNEEMCRSNQSQVFENVTIATISSESSVSAKYHDNEIALNPVDHNDSYNLNKDENKMPFERLGRSLDNDVLVNEFNATDDDSHYPELDHKTSHNTADVDHYVNDVTARSSHSLNHNTCHSVSDFYCASPKRIFRFVEIEQEEGKKYFTIHFAKEKKKIIKV